MLSGASRGLGHALALALDARGCRLCLIARDEARLTALQQQLRTPGSRQYRGDLSDPKARACLLQQILAGESRIDLIIHCAGIGSHSLLEQLSSEEVQQLLQLNSVAPLEMTAELLPLLPADDSAGIVFVGSMAGELITPGMSLYSASKHALHAFSRAAAFELAERGHFSLLVILGALRDTEFGAAIRQPLTGQPRWYRRLDVDPRQAAARIVKAIEKEQEKLVIPRWYGLVITLSRLLSPFTRFLTRYAFRQARPKSDR